jgi:RNA polymerase sigma-70 factor (ECF subfamily)
VVGNDRVDLASWIGHGAAWNLSSGQVSKLVNPAAREGSADATSAAAGDFERVLREQGAKIYTLAVRLTGNAVDGQDLAQETFVKAFEHWGRFRGESQVSSWLYRICVNLWKNRVRYEKRRSFWRHFSLSRSEREDEESPIPEVAGPDPPVDAPLGQSDRRRLLEQGLAQLEPAERSIIVLRDMGDRSYEEIAQILRLPLGTVKSRLARSRNRLRTLLERQLKE